MYRLQAVVVHKGRTMSSGHYWAYVKKADGTWGIRDDSRNEAVEESDVLEQKAYMLMYLRDDTNPTTAPSELLHVAIGTFEVIESHPGMGSVNWEKLRTFKFRSIDTFSDLLTILIGFGVVRSSNVLFWMVTDSGFLQIEDNETLYSKMGDKRDQNIVRIFADAVPEKLEWYRHRLMLFVKN
mmetsp:Transcript_29181/g.73343  ORF Transcript_29181/g.73343 Transcript_29181/m.73343 type:complete len:182 (-) Transcript_29181:374-919(-)